MAANHSQSGFPRMPPSLQLRQYQQQAVDNCKINLQVLLVICPYCHLVNQWARESEKFGLKPILAFDSARSWQNKLAAGLYEVRASSRASLTGKGLFLTIITTNATLMLDSLRSQIRYFPEKTLIIGDEVHNLGAPRLGESLPRNIGLCLALSATPERHFDEQGTEAILDYFGPVLQPELTLADAIRQKALVHYLYYPILVELTASETRKYSYLTKKIGWALWGEEKVEQNDALTTLLMQRARLIGAAANKLTALRELMMHRLDTAHTLFYCGDGAMESGARRSNNRQLTETAKLLGSELGYRVNTYTAATPVAERERLRQQFESGELQGLVAIRCLDEGVDIPAIRHAVILASSSNPRQFVQRRGRILRPHPGKERATLFDMIVLPPDLGRETLEVERNLLRKELKRFLEFADLADNAGEARVKLLQIQRRYGLLDI
ncbi:MAG: helicase [Oscillatoriales cyanobacterium]|nr:MAG: helicase [Oscillatoriales cyanobacterium]